MSTKKKTGENRKEEDDSVSHVERALFDSIEKRVSHLKLKNFETSSYL